MVDHLSYISIKREGDWWVGSIHPEGAPDDGIELARILFGLVKQSWPVRKRFLDLVQACAEAAIEKVGGRIADWRARPPGMSPEQYRAVYQRWADAPKGHNLSQILGSK